MAIAVADRAVPKQTLEQARPSAADLQWLATLLTGSPETAAGITVEAIASAGDENLFFSGWMMAWARRLVIANSLATVRKELAASVRRLTLRDENDLTAPARPWMLDRRTSKSDVEQALLAIDWFPRAALLLLLFERVPLADAAVLLDAAPELVRRGQVAGVVEMAMNLARMQGWPEQSGREFSACLNQ